MAQMVDKLSSFLGGIRSATFRDRVMPWRWRTIVPAAYEVDSEHRQLVDSLGQRTSDLGLVNAKAVKGALRQGSGEALGIPEARRRARWREATAPRRAFPDALHNDVDLVDG